MDNVKVNSKDILTGIVIAGMLIGLSLLGATYIATSAWKAVRGYDNALSVTGSTKEKVTSDSVKWTMEVSRHASESTLKDQNKGIKDDLVSVKTWLTGAGIDEKAIVIAPVNTSENFDYNKPSGQPREYMLRSTIIVSGTDVEKVTQLAKNTDSLVNQGIFANTLSLHDALPISWVLRSKMRVREQAR